MTCATNHPSGIYISLRKSMPHIQLYSRTICVGLYFFWHAARNFSLNSLLSSSMTRVALACFRVSSSYSSIPSSQARIRLRSPPEKYSSARVSSANLVFPPSRNPWITNTGIFIVRFSYSAIAFILFQFHDRLQASSKSPASASSSR